MTKLITRRSVLGSAAIGGAIAVLGGCASTTSPVSSTTPDKLTYLTGFGTTPREEYAQVSKAKGFFAQSNLDVAIGAGAPAIANLQTLAAGKADLASIDFVSAILGTKSFPDYRMVAAVQERTLLSLITVPGRGISGPKDLVGHLVGTGAGAASQTLFPTYANLAGVDPSKVKFANFTPDQLPGMLATHNVDAIGSYSIDKPSIRNATHAEPVILPYADYLTDLYGTVLVCTTKLIDSKPDAVRRFATALMKGVHYAVQHADEAGTIIKAAVPTTDPKAAAETMTLMQPYVGTGQLDSARVMRGIALLETARMAKPGLQPEDIVAFDLGPVAA